MYRLPRFRPEEATDDLEHSWHVRREENQPQLLQMYMTARSGRADSPRDVHGASRAWKHGDAAGVKPPKAPKPGGGRTGMGRELQAKPRGCLEQCSLPMGYLSRRLDLWRAPTIWMRARPCQMIDILDSQIGASNRGVISIFWELAVTSSSTVNLIIAAVQFPWEASERTEQGLSPCRLALSCERPCRSA